MERGVHKSSCSPVISPVVLLSLVGSMDKKLLRNGIQCCKYLHQINY